MCNSYIVLILFFLSAYYTFLINCPVIWCLHTNKRRPCSSTLSGHPSSSFETGWQYATEGKKCSSFDCVCKALGVEFDLAKSGERTLAIRNTEQRVQDLQAMIQATIESGTLGKQSALVLRGKVGFADSFLHGRLRSLLLKQLSEHAYSRTVKPSQLVNWFCRWAWCCIASHWPAGQRETFTAVVCLYRCCVWAWLQSWWLGCCVVWLSGRLRCVVWFSCGPVGLPSFWTREETYNNIWTGTLCCSFGVGFLGRQNARWPPNLLWRQWWCKVFSHSWFVFEPCCITHNSWSATSTGKPKTICAFGLRLKQTSVTSPPEGLTIHCYLDGALAWFETMRLKGCRDALAPLVKTRALAIRFSSACQLWPTWEIWRWNWVYSSSCHVELV